MFEKVVLRRAESGEPISAGQLAEAMLYYQRVHIVIDRGTSASLVRQIGTKTLLSILKREDVSAVYCDEMLGTHTESAGASQYHNYVAFSLAGSPDGKKLESVQARLSFDLKREGVEPIEAQRFTTAFLSRVSLRTYSSNYFVKGGIPNAAKEDLQDRSFVLEAVRRVIAATDGEAYVPKELKFDVLESDLGKFIFTNIDFKAISARRSKLSSPVEQVTPANLLTSILEARADLALASHYGGDFITSSVTSSIIQVRHSEILRRSGLNLESRRQFNEIVLADMPCLAEVIDSGERTFDEFIDLIDKASKFKKWLNSLGPDENLVRSYLRDVTREGWVARIPGKSLRYMLATAIGVVNPAGGLVAGFADTFLVDKMFGGWKPNHFISSRLSSFVQKR